MSWRSSGGSSSAPPPASQSKGGPPVLDPTLQGLMIAAAVVGLVGLGLMAALGGTLGQGSSQTAAQPTATAARPTAPPAATATPTEAPAAAATEAPAAAATEAPAAAATTAPTAAASGGATASTGTGDPTNGATLFVTSISGQIACNICHNVAPGSGTLVGPSLAGLATRAGSTVPGQSAEEYIRESIVNPSAHVVTGFTDGLMVQTFGSLATPEQIDDLVAYLLTLQ